MVTIYGMTEEFDMMALESVSNRYLDGRPVRNCSDETSARIDEVTLNIIKSCHKKAIDLLEENRALLNEISEKLLEKETLLGEEFMAMVRAYQETKSYELAVDENTSENRKEE